MSINKNVIQLIPMSYCYAMRPAVFDTAGGYFRLDDIVEARFITEDSLPEDVKTKLAILKMSPDNDPVPEVGEKITRGEKHGSVFIPMYETVYYVRISTSYSKFVETIKR